jgi:glycosyltransferase involved in cell wall biosynthesis
MKHPHVILIVNLLQDINILRPLAYMAAKDLHHPTMILVTDAFRKRDRTGVWQQELANIASDTRAEVHDFGTTFDAVAQLPAGAGVMVAASESHLKAHHQVHDLFRAAPSRFLKVTLQHGFECVGFLQSRDQDMAHGKSITFAADIVCGWASAQRLVSMAPSQRHKLQVTGPTAVLQMPRAKQRGNRSSTGLVCENMHSPRLNVAGDFKLDFLDTFQRFCSAMAGRGQTVALRPHPGGQYTIKNDVPLPANVELFNGPIYRLDLSEFAFGISAPSSILIDMVLAGIPTAVWHDPGSVMDLGNYDGLTRISSVEDWCAFAEDAIAHPQPYVDRQRTFLERQLLQTETETVYRAYARILSLAPPAQPPALDRRSVAQARIQIIAPGFIPTLQLSFLKPLVRDIAERTTTVDVISEVQLNAAFKNEGPTSPAALAWLLQRIDTFEPSVVVFCRWAGPHSRAVREYLSQAGVPVLYHIDDDLLNIPKEIDAAKWALHNSPERLESVRYLLDHADLVYCSTRALAQRLTALDVRAPLKAGEIYCAAAPLVAPRPRQVRKLGYMGIGHEHDLASIMPAVKEYLRRHPEVQFEVFGTIPIPAELLEFGAQVSRTPKIEDYGRFLETFAGFEWDIGICPLADLPFNRLKANTKWVEYTAVGAAVVASRNTVYDDCCADDCGVLAGTSEEWLAALERLTADTGARQSMVARAQHKLKSQYALPNLREQVWRMLAQARANTLAPAHALLPWPPLRRRAHERVLFISNAYVPTLQLSFVKPLAALVEAGEVSTEFISEEHIKNRVWREEGQDSAETWVRHKLAHFQPTLVVFCRYSGPFADLMLQSARSLGIPSIYHIDDDLLGIPQDIGVSKHRYHNDNSRLDTVRKLLNGTDLVYASTQKLKAHLDSMALKAPVQPGAIYCSGEVINPAVLRPVRKIGYMASADHVHNLREVVAAVVRILRKHPDVVFEFFGSISAPPEFAEFGERIRHAPKIDNYQQFLQCFAEYHWDIGICPLTSIHFNVMKANTKWVEYSSVGAAVVASRGTVYDECCADGAGLLAGNEEEWFAALDQLVSDPEARLRQVQRAQQKLASDYSLDRLREQVRGMFALARHMRIAAKCATLA